MLTGRVSYALIAAAVVVGLAAASIALWPGERHRLHVAYTTPTAVARPQSTAVTNWQEIRAAAWLRQNALAPKRTTFHRAFAAYMGLSTLMRLHRPLGGHCAAAVRYLYDNLLDLHDAYTGEDWLPLRQAVATEPSLQACAPRRGAPRLRYTE